MGYILVGLVALTVYMVVNKEWFIREHMADKPPSLTEKKEAAPTLYSINKKIESTEKKIDELSAKFGNVNTKMEAQSQQAAAAKAALDSIPSAGYNNIIPTR
jgi:hypothetical protein